MVVVVWATSGENRRADAMADADACADDTMDDAPHTPIGLLRAAASKYR